MEFLRIFHWSHPDIVRIHAHKISTAAVLLQTDNLKKHSVGVYEKKALCSIKYLGGNLLVALYQWLMEHTTRVNNPHGCFRGCSSVFVWVQLFQSRYPSPATSPWLTPRRVWFLSNCPRLNEKLRSKRWRLIAFINPAWAGSGSSTRPVLSPRGSAREVQRGERSIIKNQQMHPAD